MFKKEILIISMLFCLCVSNVVYAASFAGQTTDVSGSGKITWTEATITIEDRLGKVNGIEIQYDIYLAQKESDYLVYVCTTHQVSYSSYKGYADRFVDDYTEHGIEFKVITEVKYNEHLEAMKKTMNAQESTDKILVSDSGFRVDKHGLKFSNFGLKDGSEGVCSGFSAMSLFSYVEPSKLKNINFTSTYERVKDDDAIYKKDYMKTDVKFPKQILQSKAYNYNPSESILKSKIPHPALNFKEVITAENYDSFLESFKKFNYDLIDLEKITDSKDNNLVRGLYWLWAWKNENLFYAEDTYKMLSAYTNYNMCPASELDLVNQEFLAGHPVEIVIYSQDGAHSIVGYRLWQDTKDTNLFYIDVYDSNLPGNSDLTYFNYEPVLVVYKGMYGTNLALYYCYAPFVNYTNYKTETSYRFTKDIRFSNYKGQLLHRNNYTAAWGDELGLIAPLDF